MKKQKYYKVICTTNPYHAQKYHGFSRDGVRVHAQGLTLKEANELIFEYYKEQFGWYPNWGLACASNKLQYNAGSRKDGTRYFEYDIFKYSVEEHDEDEIRYCDHCGRAMKEGYYLTGEYACSDKCAIALYGGDEAAMRKELADDDEYCYGEVYYTSWESIIKD